MAPVKLLDKMRRTQTGWRIEDLLVVAAASAIEWRRPSRGGSHVIFSAPDVREVVCVPAERPIKPVYIKKFLALIDTVRNVQ